MKKSSKMKHEKKFKNEMKTTNINNSEKQKLLNFCL